MRNKLTMLLLALLLVAASMGLSGCRRKEVNPPATPAANRQLLPSMNTGSSPLPTPGAENSPVQP